jgi:hypothetical protein
MADKIIIPKNHTGLLIAALLILEPKTSRPIIQGIEARQKWQQVKTRHKELIEEMTCTEAKLKLAIEFHYSEKTIESIIYSR